MVRVFFGVPGSYGNMGEEVYGPYWTRGRGGAPSFLLSSPLFLSSGSAHMGGAVAPAGCCVSPLGPLGPYLLSGVPGTPSCDPICTRYPSEHFWCPNTIVLYIYQSLPLNHFETPRHVHDLIRDSEQHSVTKSHNSYNIISSTNIKCADPTGSRMM